MGDCGGGDLSALLLMLSWLLVHCSLCCVKSAGIRVVDRCGKFLLCVQALGRNDEAFVVMLLCKVVGDRYVHAC